MKFFKKIVVAILIWETRLILAKYKPYTILVTGSVGKTSTKDAIFNVARKSFAHVRKGEKSFNSEIGLPLTVIGTSNAWRSAIGWSRNMWKGFGLILFKKEYPECLILEVGADYPDDIKSIASWIKADVVVITRVSRTPVHVEFFASPEHVFEEKASLVSAIKSGGSLVIFGDDEKVLSMKERVTNPSISVLTFGLNDTNQIKGANYQTSYDTANVPSGFTFSISSKGESATVNTHGILGQTYMYPLLAAAAVGVAKGMALPLIAEGLHQYEPPRGRMNIIAGKNSATLIDDSYNSSPDAVRAALDALKSLNSTGRKIAILGDMMELGTYSANEHRAIGREVAGAVSQLISVGPRARAFAEEAVKNGMSSDSVQSFDSSYDAVQALSSLPQTGDIILIKGSQSNRMERIVQSLMREPERAGELLVRQEREWLEKR